MALEPDTVEIGVVVDDTPRVVSVEQSGDLNVAVGVGGVPEEVTVAYPGTDLVVNVAGAPRSALVNLTDLVDVTSGNAADGDVIVQQAGVWVNEPQASGDPTSLSLGTVGTDTVGITSDGGVDDVVLPAATTSTAGLFTSTQATALEDIGVTVALITPLVDQDVTSGSAPILDATNFTNMPAGGSNALDDLTDVTSPSPAEGDVIVSRSGEWVNEPQAAGGGGVTDHGALTGLADDDHPQYLEPVEVLAGANMNVDTTTTPGSVIVNAQGIVTGGMMQSEWIWHNAASAGGLASGRAAADADDVTLATTFYLHREDVPDRVDWSYHIQDFVAGWVIYAQARSDATRWHRWTVTGAPTLIADNWHIPITTLAGSPQGTEPDNNDNILVGFESPHSLSHSGLEDLGADDHTQYHTDARGDARYAQATDLDDLGVAVALIEGLVDQDVTSGSAPILDATNFTNTFWTGTQAAYDLLTPDADTLYVVVG